MTPSTYDTYLENEILHADPLQLVCILYRAALDATGAARRHLRDSEIRERARCVSKAASILHELLHCLDAGAPQGIRDNLASLYVYMLERLTEGNAQQTDAPLAEVESLLRTLLEAWTEAAAQAPNIVAEPKPDPEYAPVSCSG